MAFLEELRLLAKVASLYYEHHLRQSEIAERLDLSQASVSRMLKRATEEGIVQITVNYPRGSYTELEHAVEERFGLKEVIIVDSDDSHEQLIRNLGAATTHYLESTIRDGEVIGISSWSETLIAATSLMRPLNRAISAQVVQILGSVGSPNVETQAEQLTRRLAQLVNGEGTVLNVPGVVSSKATRDLLLSEPHVRHTAGMFEKITLALVGIGSIEPSRLLATSGNVFSNEELDAVRALGAIGEIDLHFYDQNGQQVDSPLHDRVIGMSLNQIKQANRTVGIAGGVRKHPAILGAARGRLIHVLITDYQTAKWLLQHERSSG